MINLMTLPFWGFYKMYNNAHDWLAIHWLLLPSNELACSIEHGILYIHSSAVPAEITQMYC